MQLLSSTINQYLNWEKKIADNLERNERKTKE